MADEQVLRTDGGKSGVRHLHADGGQPGGQDQPASVEQRTLEYRCTVLPEWIDYNGHMSEAFYVLAFGFATDQVMELLGMGPQYREETGNSLYTVEAHVRYLSETGEGAPLTITTTVVGAGAKKLHLAHEMRTSSKPDDADRAASDSALRDAGGAATEGTQPDGAASDAGTLIATEELLALHVNSGTGRTAPFPEQIADTIEGHRLPDTLEPPDWIGRSVSL
ncbi:thioesterase family protein [Arthrobacter sp. H14]|uniref:thioesterase family protein n=1 Tax=Arthrobacter sp. H14 TaxID=1312959 RepID=UPI0004B606C9|nr:thioesterase family protein [Arthrobacter sp. H14]